MSVLNELENELSLQKRHDFFIVSPTIVNRDFMKNNTLFVLVAVVALVALPALSLGADTQKTDQTCITKSEEDLKLKMRMLWEEHIIWTRMFIMSVADNTTDKAPVTARLLKNYDDMADALKPYYGMKPEINLAI